MCWLYLDWGAISRRQDYVGGSALPAKVIIWNKFQFKHFNIIWEWPNYHINVQYYLCSPGDVNVSTYALALFCKVVQIGFSFSENMRSKIIETCNPEHRVLEAQSVRGIKSQGKSPILYYLLSSTPLSPTTIMPAVAAPLTKLTTLEWEKL